MRDRDPGVGADPARLRPREAARVEPGLVNVDDCRPSTPARAARRRSARRCAAWAAARQGGRSSQIASSGRTARGLGSCMSTTNAFRGGDAAALKSRRAITIPYTWRTDHRASSPAIAASTTAIGPLPSSATIPATGTAASTQATTRRRSALLARRSRWSTVASTPVPIPAGPLRQTERWRARRAAGPPFRAGLLLPGARRAVARAVRRGLALGERARLAAAAPCRRTCS